MSCFNGTMYLYKEIGLDGFTDKSLSKSVYFLSHFHSDHTIGLASKSFSSWLKSNDYKLYVSEITSILLLNNPEYSHLKESIQILTINETEKINVKDAVNNMTYSLNVTALPAGHCPGSVMFFFEGSKGNILYTGDFRLNISDFYNMPVLYENSKIKRIDAVHCDTTFFSEKFKFFPSRLETTNELTVLIKNWLTLSDLNHVVLKHKATLGYEQAYVDIFNNLDEQVHINSKSFKLYSQIEELKNATILKLNNKTRIHCRCWNSNNNSKAKESLLPCSFNLKNLKPENILTISLSTMCFLQGIGTNKCFYKESENSYRALYSFHSSYNEICDFLKLIKPERAFANVVPIDCENLQDGQQRLDNVLLSIIGDNKIKKNDFETLGSVRQRSILFEFAAEEHNSPDEKRLKLDVENSNTSNLLNSNCLDDKNDVIYLSSDDEKSITVENNFKLYLQHRLERHFERLCYSKPFQENLEELNNKYQKLIFSDEEDVVEIKFPERKVFQPTNNNDLIITNKKNTDFVDFYDADDEEDGYNTFKNRKKLFRKKRYPLIVLTD